MLVQEARFSNPNRCEFEAEIDISAAAAVSATRGTGVTCVKSSTATYTFTFKGNNHAQKMYEMLGRSAVISGSPATITGAIITSISQATDGSDDITVVAKTVIANFTETATTGACTLSLKFVLRNARMTNPFD